MKANHRDGNVTGNETRTEHSLRTSELSYRRLFEAAKDAYVVKPVDFPEFMSAVKPLGIFWSVVNEPPPHNGELESRVNAVKSGI